jgi:hypothetical protein
VSVSPPREAARTVATPEGHAVDYDESGAVIGMVPVDVRFLLERDGAVTVTMPPDRVVAAQIEPALVAAWASATGRASGRLATIDPPAALTGLDTEWTLARERTPPGRTRLASVRERRGHGVRAVPGLGDSKNFCSPAKSQQ